MFRNDELLSTENSVKNINGIISFQEEIYGFMLSGLTTITPEFFLQFLKQWWRKKRRANKTVFKIKGVFAK